MASVAYDLIPLNLLQAGESAQIAEILGGPEDVQRIKELGLTKGTSLQMVRSGSPCIVRLSGQTLCFRPSEVLSILVQPGLSH